MFHCARILRVQVGRDAPHLLTFMSSLPPLREGPSPWPQMPARSPYQSGDRSGLSRDCCWLASRKMETHHHKGGDTSAVKDPSPLLEPGSCKVSVEAA